METQPPGGLSALMRMMAELQAELAEIKRLLNDSSDRPERTSLTEKQYMDYIMHVKHKSDFSDNFIHDPMPMTQQIPLRQPKPALLKPGKKPQKKYKHHCKVCDGEWIGDEPAPPTCNYCRSAIWKTGETKWALRRISQQSQSEQAEIKRLLENHTKDMATGFPLTDQTNYRYHHEQILDDQGKTKEGLRSIAGADQRQAGDSQESPYVGEGEQASCTRCGHTWTPFVRRPKQCPACRQTWYKPKAWIRNKT